MARSKPTYWTVLEPSAARRRWFWSPPRPEISACAFDTISFAGAEKIGERWLYQVWCEIGSAPGSEP